MPNKHGELVAGSKTLEKRLQMSAKSLKELFPKSEDLMDFLLKIASLPVYSAANPQQSIKQTATNQAFWQALLDGNMDIRSNSSVIGGDYTMVIGLDILEDGGSPEQFVRLDDVVGRLEAAIERAENNTDRYAGAVSKAENITDDFHKHLDQAEKIVKKQKKISKQMEKASDDSHRSDASTKLTPLYDIPDLHRHYQPRAGYHEKIACELSTKNIAVINQRLKPQQSVVAGSGGVGKTQLVLAYAHWLLGQVVCPCSIIAFIRSESRNGKGEQLEQSYREFAENLRISTGQGDVHLSRTDLLREVKNKLQDYLTSYPDQSILLLFDNVDDQERLKPYLESLRTLGSRVKVLVTTRDSTWEGATALGVYTEIEAISYLLRALLESKALARLDETLEKTLTSEQLDKGDELLAWFKQTHPDAYELSCQLVEKLHRYPLALTHAVAYCVGSEQSIAAYLKDYDDLLAEVILSEENEEAEQAVLGDDYSLTVYLTLRLSLDKCRGLVESSNLKEQAIGKAALQILAMSAYLPADNISKALLSEAVGGKTHIIREALKWLQSASLVYPTEKKDTLSMHRMVQTVVHYHWSICQEDLSNIGLSTQSILTALMEALAKQLPSIHTIDASVSSLHHKNRGLIESLESVIAQVSDPSELLLTLQSQLGHLYDITGQPASALDWQEKVLSQPHSQIHGKAHLRKASALRGLRRYLEASRYLADHRADWEDAHILEGRYQQSQLLCLMHSKQSAQASVTALLDDLQTSPEDNETQYLSRELHLQLARLARDLGDYAVAQSHLDKTLPLIAPEDHQYQGRALLLQAQVFAKRKDFKASKETGEKALEHLETFYGSEEEHVVLAMVKLAEALLDSPYFSASRHLAEQIELRLAHNLTAGEAKAHRLLAKVYDRRIFIQYPDNHQKEQALIHYKLAAEKGDSRAQVRLSAFYLSQAKQEAAWRFGLIVPEGRQAAYGYLQLAAKSGDFEGQYHLARLMLQGNLPQTAEQTPALLEDVYKYLLTAADSGYAKAQYVLAGLYLSARAATEDPIKRAQSWLANQALPPSAPQKPLNFLRKPLNAGPFPHYY